MNLPIRLDEGLRAALLEALRAPPLAAADAPACAAAPEAQAPAAEAAPADPGEQLLMLDVWNGATSRALLPAAHWQAPARAEPLAMTESLAGYVMQALEPGA